MVLPLPAGGRFAIDLPFPFPLPLPLALEVDAAAGPFDLLRVTRWLAGALATSMPDPVLEVSPDTVSRSRFLAGSSVKYRQTHQVVVRSMPVERGEQVDALSIVMVSAASSSSGSATLGPPRCDLIARLPLARRLLLLDGRAGPRIPLGAIAPRSSGWYSSASV